MNFIGETTQITKALETDYTVIPVCDLWSCEEGKTAFKYCPIAIPDDIIQDVYYFTHHDELSSSVFLKLFEAKKALYLSDKQTNNILLEAVVKELWQPTLSEFSEDFKNLRDGLKLPLSKIEVLFKDIYQLNKIEEELGKWCDAVKEDNRKWLKDAAQKLMDYHELCRYSFTAQTIMQLKEKLRLKGDFSIVEILLPKKV